MELYIEPDFAYQRKNRDSNGRFKPGMTPWNKGLKGLDIGGRQTQFKPGFTPHNTKHDMAITTRYHKREDRHYKFIRIAKGKWELLHRYVWRQHYGEIPKGMIIAFRDGNALNCDIGNLECISRKENMARNRNREKQSASMREKWRKSKLRALAGLPPISKLRLDRGYQANIK